MKSGKRGKIYTPNLDWFGHDLLDVGLIVRNAGWMTAHVSFLMSEDTAVRNCTSLHEP
jgi:hypothetical protein